MSEINLANIVEATLFAAGKPLTLAQVREVFEEHERPDSDSVKEAIAELQERYASTGLELVQVASGYRFQVRQSLSDWVGRLNEERPQRYSRALLETLALITYRQPITRGEIEEIRGVAVSSNIVKTLLERGWIRIVGHRDVPGRPAMYATTRQFLDYFNLKSLDQLPPLAEVRDFETLNAELGFVDPSTALPDAENEASDVEVGAQEGGVSVATAESFSEDAFDVVESDLDQGGEGSEEVFSVAESNLDQSGEDSQDAFDVAESDPDQGYENRDEQNGEVIH
jgi:segregation and condensation protein B